MEKMTQVEWRSFLLTGARTAKLATVRPDSRPHVAPVWFTLDGDDLVFMTADHGNDPTYARGTDHTREYVPILVTGPGVRAGVDLGTRESFADLGATVEEALGLEPQAPGRSFLAEIV